MRIDVDSMRIDALRLWYFVKYFILRKKITIGLTDCYSCAYCRTYHDKEDCYSCHAEYDEKNTMTMVEVEYPKWSGIPFKRKESVYEDTGSLYLEEYAKQMVVEKTPLKIFTTSYYKITEESNFGFNRTRNCMFFAGKKEEPKKKSRSKK